MRLPHLTQSALRSWATSQSRSRSRGHSATSPCWPSHRETLLLPNTVWSLQRQRGGHRETSQFHEDIQAQLFLVFRKDIKWDNILRSDLICTPCFLTRHDQPVFAHSEGQAGQILPLVRHRIKALDAAQHHLIILSANGHYHFSRPCCHGNRWRRTEGE